MNKTKYVVLIVFKVVTYHVLPYNVKITLFKVHLTALSILRRVTS